MSLWVIHHELSPGQMWGTSPGVSLGLGGLRGCREDLLCAPFEFKPFQGSFHAFLANRGALVSPAPRGLTLRGSAGSAAGGPLRAQTRCRAHPCEAELAAWEASYRETQPPTALHRTIRVGSVTLGVATRGPGNKPGLVTPPLLIGAREGPRLQGLGTHPNHPHPSPQRRAGQGRGVSASSSPETPAWL